MTDEPGDVLGFTEVLPQRDDESSGPTKRNKVMDTNKQVLVEFNGKTMFMDCEVAQFIKDICESEPLPKAKEEDVIF